MAEATSVAPPMSKTGGKKRKPPVAIAPPLGIHARARDPESHPLLATVAERVAYIANLMADRTYNERSSRELRKILGERWGVRPDTVVGYATEAAHSLEAALRENRAGIAVRAVERLEELAESCAASGVPGDAGAAVKANEILLKSSGFAEADERPSAPNVTIVLGQIGKSPVTSALVGTIDAQPEVVSTLFGDAEVETAAELPEHGESGSDAAEGAP